jgi:protein gp37
MSDLFHDDVTRDDHETIFGLMRANERHTFILLTKRPERMRLAFGGRIQPPNVWIGITAENQARFDERWPVLESIPVDLANNRKFISIEPMLGPVKLSESCLNYASWIIAGPENGAGKRPFEPDWIDRLSGQCERTGIPFFDKRELEGVIREMPE